jgi:hypothetical protein
MQHNPTGFLPLKFADGGFVNGGDINWANLTNGDDTQNQMNQMMSSGGMAQSPLSAMGNQLQQPDPSQMMMQPSSLIPPTVSGSQLAMAKGGHVTSVAGAEKLVALIKAEFEKRGIDFDKCMKMLEQRHQ